MATKIDAYDRDFYQWTEETARALREGRPLAAGDVEHLAEEVEDLGKRDRRAVASRAAALLAHLLKWKYQPQKRSGSWEATIKIQRLELCERLEESPSLRTYLELAWAEAIYRKATLRAVQETGLAAQTFPPQCPFSLSEALDSAFLP